MKSAAVVRESLDQSAERLEKIIKKLKELPKPADKSSKGAAPESGLVHER
jgi:hypothetical protein